MKKEFNFSEEFGNISDQMIEEAGKEWHPRKYPVLQFYGRKIACVLLVFILGMAAFRSPIVQATVEKITSEIGRIMGFQKDLLSYTSDIQEQSRTKNGITVTLKEAIADERILMVEADIVMQDGTLASWINSEKTTFDGKVFHPIEETYSTGKSGKFIYVERYSEDILTDETAKVHLIVEAGKDPGTGVGLDDAGSIAEFAFDFIVDAKALEAKTRTRELDIEIPMPKFPSGKMRLQELTMNDLYTVINVPLADEERDLEFWMDYEYKLKGKDNFGNPVSMELQTRWDSDDLEFRSDFVGDYESGESIPDGKIQISLADKDCSYLELQLYERKIEYEQVDSQEDDEYEWGERFIPPAEENYGWKEVGEPFRIQIDPVDTSKPFLITASSELENDRRKILSIDVDMMPVTDEKFQNLTFEITLDENIRKYIPDGNLDYKVEELEDASAISHEIEIELPADTPMEELDQALNHITVTMKWKGGEQTEEVALKKTE